MTVTIDHDETRPRHLWSAREYQIGSHPAITAETGPFPSYSTVAGLYSNAPAFAASAAKINSEYYKGEVNAIAAKEELNALSAVVPLISVEHALRIVSDTGPYRRKWKQAADTGTDMHERFQEILTKRGAPEGLVLYEAESITVLAIQKWRTLRSYRQLKGEEVVADPRHRTAGRYDSLGTAHFKHGKADRLWLVDLKTGKSVKPNAFMQVAGYWAALELGGHEIHGAIILHAPIGAESVTEHIVTRKELKEHYKAFLAIRHLWDWHVKHGALR